MDIITVDDIGKVNASKPTSIGKLGFYDPRALADYMAMPGRLYNVETRQRCETGYHACKTGCAINTCFAPAKKKTEYAEFSCSFN
jgi:hypothetical protein